MLALSLVHFLAALGAAAEFETILALPRRTENLVYRDQVKPNWLPDGKTFWYRVQTGPRTAEFVRIDAATGERKSASSLAGLGLPGREAIQTSQSKIELRNTRRTGNETDLTFVNQTDAEVELFWINPQGEQVNYGTIAAGRERQQHTFEGHVWLIARRTGEPLAVVEADASTPKLLIDGKGISAARERRRRPTRGMASPDGKWSVFLEKGLVMLQEVETGDVRALETELDSHPYFRGGIAWAPDSLAFVVSYAPDVERRQVTLVDSSPRDQVQPRLKTMEYVKPGDPLPQPVPVLFRLRDDGHDATVIKNDLFATPFTQSMQVDVQWSPEGNEFFFNYNQRGHALYRILAVDRSTGNVRVVVEEKSDTFIDYTQKTWRHWLPATDELLWMSERDGWCHLYLYDAATGELKQQVTQGEWPVRSVVHVDADKREVWFMASGLKAEEDPYHLHLCRVQFDGSGFCQLTSADGHHRIEFSPDRAYFTASWSRADHPPVHELRRSEDGALVCELEKSDASSLVAAGWTLPERIVAKGRDGKTDIHGILIKPSHFDPAKKYPVVEEIYAGPHGAFAPKEFGRLMRQHQIAELGFIVVQMDGMGTNHRGKAFHDVAWKNLKDAGFPDRIAWMREAAATRPWMDLTRVGIYGGSAGGQNAMRAVLDHHDFYKVAVADCGCHDNRMDKIWWNEQWLGWPVDDAYPANSNLEDAHKLQGRLLLIVGELDSNVDPASTTQVVGALQKAGKSFDYMPIVGAGHGAAETPYGSQLRMRFLARHLLQD